MQSVQQRAPESGGESERGGAEGSPLSAPPAPLSALQLLPLQAAGISTSCLLLDRALGGGIPVGALTEICGGPGVGKTQLCLQLAVNVQLLPAPDPAASSSRPSQSLLFLLGPPGSFRLERLQEIAASSVREGSSGVEEVLSNVLLVRCSDLADFRLRLLLLPSLLESRPSLRLLLLDGVASMFRSPSSDGSLRLRLLQEAALQLAAAAAAHRVAVVTTNQLTTRQVRGRWEVGPALGELWGHAASVRLMLQWAGPRRVAAVLKSPRCPDAAVPYAITGEGFRDEPITAQGFTGTGQSQTGAS